jgi:glutamate 5-kinase
MAGGTTSATAVGGMITKIAAAKLATKSGCGVFIASGAEPEIVQRLLAGQGPGTFFVPSGLPLDSRKRWLAYFQRPSACLKINACAVPVLREKGSSLLAVGVTGAKGEFAAGDVVNVAGPDGAIVARGKVMYASDEIPALAGRKSDELRQLYPDRKHVEVIHRNDLVLL